MGTPGLWRCAKSSAGPRPDLHRPGDPQHPALPDQEIGGTGLTGRDITPEAIDEIADKQIPGFGEVFRTISLKTVGTSAIQSRACAVLANGKYVFALPGSSGGVTDAWDGILKYQLDINHKPCNFVELFPRLKE